MKSPVLQPFCVNFFFITNHTFFPSLNQCTYSNYHTTPVWCMIVFCVFWNFVAITSHVSTQLSWKQRFTSGRNKQNIKGFACMHYFNPASYANHRAGFYISTIRHTQSDGTVWTAEPHFWQVRRRPPPSVNTTCLITNTWMLWIKWEVNWFI